LQKTQPSSFQRVVRTTSANSQI